MEESGRHPDNGGQMLWRAMCAQPFYVVFVFLITFIARKLKTLPQYFSYPSTLFSPYFDCKFV